jgi:hypothetical protein
MTEFKDRLNEALDMRNMTAAELSRLSGVNEGAISQYRKGSYKANQQSLEKIAKALNVSIPWLMGADVKSDVTTIPNHANIFPIETKKIPLLGKIAAGQPVMAEECFDSYVQCGNFIKADFCLRVQGDSMINARIYDGDIVFIHQQPEVENGEIAAVAIDDAVTLKRVYISDSFVELRAENPRYKPMVFDNSNCLSFRILGKAIAFQGDIN